MGSPVPIEKNLAYEAINYFVPNDPVTFCWAPKRHSHEKYNIVRLPSAKSMYAAHAFANEQYGEARRMIGDRASTHLGDRKVA